jgi:NAD(P)-dependent dehydrogenase (short-subunit alcohol dehydrogenase family)
MMAKGKSKQIRPKQEQHVQPGHESEMKPKPKFEYVFEPGQKLKGKKALISGGDSGIGRAVAVLFAKEGADVSIVYYNEHEDAKLTKQEVERENRKCLLISGDIKDHKFCEKAVKETISKLGGIDILVNNAAVQFVQEEFTQITPAQLDETFRTNIYSYFYFALAAVPHMKEGSTIINTTSVTAYRGSYHLIDYSATKGAIVTFTRSLASNLVKKGIRVNGVAPGPVWTPLIPASNDKADTSKFGSDSPMGRAAEPREIAPCYVFLASRDSCFITGQVLHPNGGEIING